MTLPKTAGGLARFWDGEDDFAWLGKDVELVGEVYDTSVLLKDTSFKGWTPSTTAKTIIASKTLSQTVDVDMEQYEYALRWKFDCPIVYDGSQTDVARTLRVIGDQWQSCFRRANSLANVAADNPAGNACMTMSSIALIDYWNNNGSHTYTWSASYGIYPAVTAATFASSTNLQTKMTIKTPSVSARCSTTYFSTGNAGHVDQNQTTIKMKGYLYRYKPTGIMFNLCKNIDQLYGTPL